MSTRQADPSFVAELRRRFPDVRDLRWNDAVNRWELISDSAAGRPVSQFWGWFHDPFTGQKLEPDPVTGLLPFRDLATVEEKQLLIANLEKGFRFGRGADGTDWYSHIKKRSEWNTEQKRERIKQRAQDFAYMLQQVDLRRPWRKFHERKPGQGRIIIT